MKFRVTTTLIAAAVAAALSAAAATATASMADDASNAHRSNVVTAWAAAWNGTDPNALGALFTTNSTYTDQAIGVTMTGRQEIAGWKARTDMVIDNVRVTINSTYRAGDHVTIEAIYAGHIKGAPKPFAVPLATLLDTHGRQITSDQDFYSLNSVLAQSGLPADWTPSVS